MEGHRREPILGMDDLYWLGRVKKAGTLIVSPHHESGLRLILERGLVEKQDEGGYCLSEFGQNVMDRIDKVRAETARR